MEYNLEELDAALSDHQHQAAVVGGPQAPSSSSSPHHHRQHTEGGRRTVPGTRRGSLIPGASSLAGALPGSRPAPANGGGGGGSSGGDGVGKKKKKRKKARSQKLEGLDLFNFDLKELVKDFLLPRGDSCVSYHEYAAFAPPETDAEGDGDDPRSPSIMSEGEEGLKLFRQAIRDGYGLDIEGNFTPKPKGQHLLQGRMRQVIAHRRIRPGLSPATGASTPDGLELTVEDYAMLGLHSGTLPSLQRVTVESSFWDRRRETFHLILSFSASPQPPYDFLSMAYKLKTRTATALIRRSFDARWHEEDALDEYDRRLDSCRARWAHPLVLAVVLLQVQLFRTEEAVQSNNGEVILLEGHVDAVTGTTGQANAEAWRKIQAKGDRAQFAPLKRLSTWKGMVEEKVGRRSHDPTTSSVNASLYDPDYVPPQTIHLMKEAHDVLKGAIQLLDTLRWMERAVKLLIQAGDELDVRVRELRARAAATRKGNTKAGGKDDKAEKESKEEGEGEDEEEEEDDDEEEEQEEEEEPDELCHHWHEIRQYLDCLWRLCTSLETDRRMSELRCRAQIDIVYSKMAQEDNNLNARMAVASTRDSSSMKALAVITAVFLPGEYIGTLFGVDMFNWQRGTAGDPSISEDAPAEGWPRPVVMPSFWVYWAFTLPLTLFIVSIWRAWWVNQDRYFRRHLSTELSNERYWTTDGRPRHLETSFLQDFFSLLSRSGAKSTTNSAILGTTTTTTTTQNHPATPNAVVDQQQQYPPLQSPGLLLKRGLTLTPQGSSFGKDRDPGDAGDVDEEEEEEGMAARHMRFRQISFAREPRQTSAV